MSTALEGQTGVASVDPAVTNDARDIAIIGVTPTTSPQDARTGDLLEHIRQDTLPAALDGTEVEASVTGSTALTDDVSTRLQDRMPWFLGAVSGCRSSC